jgi:Flp pilus assembly pilin Flp
VSALDIGTRKGAHSRYLPASLVNSAKKENPMRSLSSLFRNDQGQDIAEYAVMLAVILVLVVGTVRLVGSNANNVFSSVGSSIQ